MPDKNEIFTILARLCKRCGRIITSSQAIKDGYGHTCLQKVLERTNTNKPLEGQMSLGIELGGATENE